jgi:DNA-binding beta-propeller fold protein YncE
MKPSLHRSLLEPIVLLQAYLVLFLCLASCAFGEPAVPGARSDSVSAQHVESIVCMDHVTGIEFAPLGVCLDILGDLYVVDSDNSRIYTMAHGDHVLSLFSECPPDYPECDFIDLAGSRAGGTYVSDRSDGLILYLDRWGEPGAYVEVGEGVAGIGEGKAGLVVAAMGIDGSISMVDFDKDTEALETTIKHSEGNAYPVDCRVLDDGTIVVTDSFSKQVLFLSSLGEIKGVARGFAFENPFGVACIGDRYVLVADSGRGLVAVFDPAGRFMFAFGEGILDVPTFLDSTPDGLVCVSDPGRMTIEVFRIGEVPSE